MKPRLRAYSRALIGVVLAFSLLLQLVWVALNVGVLRDYGSFIAAGKAVEDGDNPYGVYEDTFRVQLAGYDIDSPNLNPPASLYLFEVLDEVNPYAGKAVLNVISLALFSGIVWALLRDSGRKLTPGLAIWLVSLAGFWHIIELGQIYMPLLAAVTCAWIVQDKRPLLAGVLIGLTVAIKPNFAIWPALLLLAGDRKTSLSSFATAAVLSALPVLTYGPEVYGLWIDASREFSGMTLPNNSSILSIFARAGLEAAGIAASGVVLVTMAIWAYATRPSPRELAGVALIGALALGPITWSGYTVFALPVLLYRPWRSWECAAAITMIVPVWLVLTVGAMGPVANFLVGSMYGWGLLILLGLLAGDAYRRGRRPKVTAASIVDDREALAV